MRKHPNPQRWPSPVWPLVVALSVTSCTDSLAPSVTTERPVDTDVSLLGRPIGEAVSFEQLNVLPHNLLLASAESAPSGEIALAAVTKEPALDRYEVAFWAVKGKKKRVTIYYLTDDDEKKRFLRFTIPKEGLARRPDGTTIVTGDSVLITLRIDAANVIASFSPPGLAFSDKRPATLRIWYGGLLEANGGDDGETDDGDSDDDDNDDDDASVNVVVPDFWYRQHAVDNWNRVASEHNKKRRWIKTYIYHFSDYAISW